jgi:hypothetical protein
VDRYQEAQLSRKALGTKTKIDYAKHYKDTVYGTHLSLGADLMGHLGWKQFFVYGETGYKSNVTFKFKKGEENGVPITVLPPAFSDWNEIKYGGPFANLGIGFRF